MNKINIILPGLLWHDVCDYEYIKNNTSSLTINKIIKYGNISTLNFNYSDLWYRYQYKIPHNDNNKLTEYLSKQYQIVKQHKYHFIATMVHINMNNQIILNDKFKTPSIATQKNIIDKLNEYFADKMSFYFLDDNMWLAGHDDDNLAQYSHPCYLDMNHKNCLILDNNLKYHQLITEMQLFLSQYKLNHHNHTNEYNTLWLWDKTYTIPCGIPEYINLLDLLYKKSDNIIFNDELYKTHNQNNVNRYIEKLFDIDENVIKPIYNKLHGNYKMINIYIPNQQNTIKIEYKLLDRLKFWKKNNITNLTEEPHETKY